MVLNYIKTAFRNIIKYKGYSLLNIAGLAIGIGLFSLVASFVEFQFSFDQFHKGANRIHAVVQVLPSGTSGQRHTALTRVPLRNRLLKEFSEIEDATRWVMLGRRVVNQDDNKFYQEEGTISFVDPNFLSFFSFGMIAGDPENALTKPKSVVLTESAARRYFGTENAIGRTLMIGNTLEAVITGITRDIPSNSSLSYEVLVSLKTYDLESNWNIHCSTFVRLAENKSPSALVSKFPRFIENVLSDTPISVASMYLLPLTDLHLNSWKIKGFWRTEPRVVILMTLAIGGVLLLVVGFNFINMAMTQYLTRAKEIGVRKVVGASQPQLMLHFLGESIVLAIITLPAALVVNEIMAPLFGYLIGEKIWIIGPDIWSNPFLMVKLLGITILLGILAGSYPAFYLSRLRPIQIFKKDLPTGKKGELIRSMLVVSQFITAILAVLISLSTFTQYHFLLNLNLGFQKQNVIAISLGTNYGRYELQTMKADLIRHPDVIQVSSAVWVPSEWNSERRVVPEGIDEKDAWTMNAYGIDYDFIELLEMEIVKGRAFSRKHADRGKFIINETAAAKLDWTNPIGKTLTFSGKTGEIIGVVKDFHFKSMMFKIIPSVLYLESNYFNFLYIKHSDAGSPRVLNFIENRWRQFSPDIPFEYFSLSHRIENNLIGVKKWAGLAGVIGIITLLFSCLGLLGLASYATQQRTKEIGIRKAHGATTFEIARVFLIEFSKLLILAGFVSLFLFYLINKKIMPSTFAYAAQIGFGTYILACLFSLCLGLTAVIYHTIKAARANPVNALKYE